MPYMVETTDTFGGDANYCWVRRYLINTPRAEYGTPAYRRQLVMSAKAATGWTGVKCDADYQHASDITLRPRRMCQVTFITWLDDCMVDHFSGEDLRTDADADKDSAVEMTANA